MSRRCSWWPSSCWCSCWPPASSSRLLRRVLHADRLGRRFRPTAAPHDLHHAHATWLLDAGVSLPAIHKRLGHAEVMTTLGMYGHPATDSEDRILAALDDLS